MRGRYAVAVAVVAMSLLTAGEYTAKADQLYLIRGNGTGKMTVEQLLTSYENNSAIGRQIRNELYLASLEEQNARTSKVNAEDVSAKLQEALAELEQQKALSEVMEDSGEEQVQLLEQQMEQLEAKRKEQELAVLGADLGWEQKAFYTQNSSTLCHIRTNQEKYAFLSQVLNLSVLDKQKEYYSCYEELLEIRRKVAAVRGKYGVTSETEEKEILLEEKKVEEYVLSANETKESILDRVTKVMYYGNASLILNYETEWKEYKEGSTIQRFLNNSEAYLQAGYYQQMYRDYGHRLPAEQTEAKEQAEALADGYALQEEVIRLQIEAYAKAMLSAYEEAKIRYDTAEEARTLCEKKYNAECIKQEYGRATKQSVLESKGNLLNAEKECLQCVTEKVRLEYVLDNGIISAE